MLALEGRDHRRLMGLGVGTQGDSERAGASGHLLKVREHASSLDHQRRRGHIVEVHQPSHGGGRLPQQLGDVAAAMIGDNATPTAAPGQGPMRPASGGRSWRRHDCRLASSSATFIAFSASA